MRTYSSEGIVLSRTNYGEADRILTIFSKNFGKIRVLAKGVRKPKSKKRGHVEIFSKIKLHAARSGKGLELLTEAELIDSYPEIRASLVKTSVSYYLCEVVDRLIREDEKHENIYEDLLDSLEEVKNGKNLKHVREHFVTKALVLLGFWPYGKRMEDVDEVLSEIIERQMSTVRVGKRILV